MRSAESRKVNDLEMKRLRILVDASRINRVRNKEVCGALASRVDQGVLRWLGHAERMDECRMARKVLMASTG